MNLHLSHYPNGFIKHFRTNQQQYLKGENRYVIYTSKVAGVNDCTGFEIVAPDLEELEALVGAWEVYEAVYIHYLSSFLIEVINILPKKLKVVWIFWGADGFSQIKHYLDDYCLKEQTKAYYDKKERPRMKWCKNPFYLYKNYVDFKNSYPTKSYKNYLKAVARVDYFAHYIPEDFHLLKQYTDLSAIYVDFNYMSMVQCHIPNRSNSYSKPDMLIGNSADWSNNHLDLLSHLSSCQLSSIGKIYAPLSYGGNKDYLNTVLQAGKNQLGEQFTPLTDYLPLEEYYAILSTISMAVIGTVRSQAAGNILSLLMQGTRVYLDPRNTLFQLLKSEGIIIYNLITTLEKHLEEGAVGFLTAEETIHNNKIIARVFGENAVKEKYSNLLELNAITN